MDQKQQQAGKADDLTRRRFIRDSAMAAAGLAVGLGAAASQSTYADEVIEKTRSYNPDMEYRRLGKTNLWVSAVCMGGHWKRVNTMVPGLFKGNGWLSADLNDLGFKKNRYDVVTRCMELGINYIDACTPPEILAYAEALRGRRDEIYLGFSWYTEEMRKPDYRATKALLGTLEKGMREARLDYVDLWRPTMLEQSGKHTKDVVEEMMGALEKAKKQGKARFAGFSSHDRPHIKWMIETYPDIIDVIVTPYTARSKIRPRDSLFDALRKYDVGCFGIKPFSSNSLFKGDSSLSSPYANEDDRDARLAIRYILATDAITAPIAGLINTHQVDNVVKAVKERRQLDVAETKELEKAMDQAWAKLPAEYEWLKDWEYV
jgi:aryl-alcohol dehydrogenase-like predicted oxidoreductase